MNIIFKSFFFLVLALANPQKGTSVEKKERTTDYGKIAKAIEISRKTNKIVWQNIIFALGVKAIVLILSAGGVATMWEAIFADVGVAVIAILNSMRVMKMK